jgi:dGTPase
MKVLSITKKFNQVPNFKNFGITNSTTENQMVLDNLRNVSGVNLVAYNPNITFRGLNAAAFKEFAANEANPLWAKITSREVPFISSKKDYRNIFDIDFDRILHSGSYGRMRLKTQAFVSPKNDTISTRLTHVEQVSSIAQEIAEHLGLNVKLTRAIAIGHDVGHSPFGHPGEHQLNEIAKREELGFTFWHEKNSMRFLDDIETEKDVSGKIKNLNLTYAVRDGIISHCGEIDENGLKPRKAYIDLRNVEKTDNITPFTWEGCVMRVSDKIAYIGKDIEDALILKVLDPKKITMLKQTIKKETGFNFKEINNSALIKHFVSDLLQHSNPKDGLTFSPETFKLMNLIKAFNYKEIYIPRENIQGKYTSLVIESLFSTLDKQYAGKNTLKNLDKMAEKQPQLAQDFKKWLIKYSDVKSPASAKYENRKIYSIENQKDYKRSVIEFISGMTDRYAIESFNSTIFQY